MKYPFKYFILPVAALLLTIIAGCSLEKKSRVNRALQNLTTRYNILFNANELLQQKQDNYASTFIDAYDRVLRVYQDTISHIGTADKDLEAIVARANTIISVKEQSHYTGDAYLLLGKAAFLNADYFNAVEYFSYIVRSYPTEAELIEKARTWQVRALLYINQQAQAKAVLDSALLNVDAKNRSAADVYGAALQYYIDNRNYPTAEETAQQAVDLCRNKQQRLRWTFILAQLQELNHKPAEAYESYTRVVKSNAPFEMAFNADLNRIRIDDVQNGRNISRTDRLKTLLRNQNNADFTDQIYYQLAELQLSNNQVDEAIKNYQLSVKNSTRNQTQKGLSYLRLADISFKNKGNYPIAKQYYDSTLISLPSNYPGYITILKKADNLQLLADKMGIITREDTLQMLAKLDDRERALRIEEMVNLRLQQAGTTANVNNPFTNTGNPADAGNLTAAGSITQSVNAIADASGPTIADNVSAPGISSFYFDNAAAVSQGFSDFKRKWGNRRLEDNWRRSNRYNSDITNNTLNTTQKVNPGVLPGQAQRSTNDVLATGYRQELLQNIPVTAPQLTQSNTRIYNAYLDIANFYRDILNDRPEAISIYETLVSHFPDNDNQPAILYNLYRLYSDNNPAKAETYKKLLLDKYASSIYARVLNDPDYARRLDDKDAELNAFYNDLYDLYAKRQYSQVISRANELLQQYADNKLAPQLAYLRTIASGHLEKVTPFRAELLQIAASYPNDRLITPLVQQHLAYIDANQAEMATRPFALIDSDPNAPSFVPAPVIQQPVSQQRPATAALQTPVKPQPAPAKPSVTQPATANLPSVPAPPPSIFSKRDSSNYYFVVNVSTGTVNLSSSRFGIGQFNRTAYQGSTIRHQLKPVGNDNQLVYVGRFTSADEAKDYARNIVPLLAQIMKVPADKYSFFIITQENLDKLADRKLLDSYVEYYQKNY